MNVLDLFSGIGGFSLGLERAGMRTVAFCEIEPFQQAILRKHWPEVPCYDDIRDLTADRLRADGIAVDAICGGFPCQDISFRGLGAGLAGERSGLWFEYARLIGEVRPRVVIVENVAALLSRGLDIVLGTLATLGYDAEWHCIPASAVGAPHRRDRVWIIAYPDRQPGRTRAGRGDGPQAHNSSDETADAAPLLGPAFFREQSDRALQRYWPTPWQEQLETICGMDDGASARVDALGSLGNTVCPQIPEIIGKAIMRANITLTQETPK